LSGNGLTLQNLYNLGEAGKLPARIVLVISNKTDAFGLERAKKMNVPALAITRKEAGSLEEFSRRIFDECRQAQADLVVLGGFSATGPRARRLSGAGHEHPSGVDPGLLRQGILRAARSRSGARSRREGDGLHGALRGQSV